MELFLTLAYGCQSLIAIIKTISILGSATALDPPLYADILYTSFNYE